MKVQSGKAKGRKLQQWVRDKLHQYCPELRPGDVESTSMGAGGEDVKLSPHARDYYPVQFECKNYAKFAVYEHYKQACTHGTFEPVLVIKQNNSKPLAVVDADWFFAMLGEKGRRNET
jgi:hypothetical protein